MNLKFFVDFDGTICQDDLGNKIFKEIGEFDKHYKQLVHKEIGIREYWHKLCNSVFVENPISEIKRIASESEIDYYFIEFYQWLRNNSYDITIVSDGFSDYIDIVLNKYNISEIKVYSNRLNYSNNKLLPFFPGAQDYCQCFCASCKRNVVLNNSDNEDIIVYIGDGNSDFCPAEYSDIVFAKKSLASFCNANKIPHYPYKNFFDIKKIMNDLITKNKIKKRNVASIKRKNAFENE